MSPIKSISPFWLFAALLLAAVPCRAEGPVIYVGTSDDALELSVSTRGHFFAEVSAGEWRDGKASYAAVRVGARTTGRYVFEISAGPASVDDCADRLGGNFRASFSIGSGFSEGPLLLMFNMRYIQSGARLGCTDPARSEEGSEVIGLAGIGYRF